MTKKQIEAIKEVVKFAEFESNIQDDILQVSKEAIEEMEQKKGKETRAKEITQVEGVAKQMFEIILDFLATKDINIKECTMAEFLSFAEETSLYDFHRHLQKWITSSSHSGTGDAESDSENTRRNK